MGSRVPPLPPNPTQVTRQVVVTVTVKKRSFTEGPVCGWPALLRRYVYEQSVACDSAERDLSYGVPGPSHTTEGDPSPGSQLVLTGVAVTSAHTGPACVRCRNGTHCPGSTHHHVGRFTRAGPAGLRRTAGRGSTNVFAADLARAPASTTAGGMLPAAGGT